MPDSGACRETVGCVMAWQMAPFIDSITDLQGKIWRVNDRVLHTIPGVRSDVGRISELLTRVRATVTFEDGGRCAIYFSELVLVSRRTKDEIPYAAGEGITE